MSQSAARRCIFFISLLFQVQCWLQPFVGATASKPWTPNTEQIDKENRFCTTITLKPLIKEQRVFSQRLLQIQCNTNHYRKSLPPPAVKWWNDLPLCKQKHLCAYWPLSNKIKSNKIKSNMYSPKLQFAYHLTDNNCTDVAPSYLKPPN